MPITAPVIPNHKLRIRRPPHLRSYIIRSGGTVCGIDQLHSRMTSYCDIVLDGLHRDDDVHHPHLPIACCSAEVPMLWATGHNGDIRCAAHGYELSRGK